MSDQFNVFAGRVISCSVRAAIYVLDGLLENETVLRPREHMTDTHGYTEQLFGLCHLLGYAFMPRLADLKDQQLYRLDRSGASNKLAPVFRGAVDVALIAEQWDQLARLAASLRNRTAPAHVVMDRLVANSPSDRLAKALTMLGRVVKTIHILRGPWSNISLVGGWDPKSGDEDVDVRSPAPSRSSAPSYGAGWRTIEWSS